MPSSTRATGKSTPFIEAKTTGSSESSDCGVGVSEVVAAGAAQPANPSSDSSSMAVAERSRLEHMSLTNDLLCETSANSHSLGCGIV